AQRFFKVNKSRLVEGAYQTARVRDRAFDSGPVARIGAQISRTQFMRGKHRDAAAEIEDQIAGRNCAVARRSEQELGARGRQWQRVVVDRKLKPAEMSAGVTDSAFENRKLIGPARRYVTGLCDKPGEVEAVRKTLGGLDCDLIAAIDKRHAVAFERHQRDRRHLFPPRGNHPRGFAPRPGPASPPAAATNAAGVGPAAAASFDQPPVSRMLTKVSWACGKFSATSLNSGASWVQATVIGAPLARASLNRSSSRPQSWLACVILAVQPRPIASASSGMVFSQLQIRR